MGVVASTDSAPRALRRPQPGDPENRLIMEHGPTPRRYRVPADLPWRQRLWIRSVLVLVGG